MGYSLRHRLGARSNIANEPLALIWNPHASLSVSLGEVWFQQNGVSSASGAYLLARATARGTPTSTATSAAANDEEGAAAPDSGLLIDDCSTIAPPTFSTTDILAGLTMMQSAASGFIIPFRRPLLLPAGRGIVIFAQSAATMATSDVVAVWDE